VPFLNRSVKIDALSVAMVSLYILVIFFIILALMIEAVHNDCTLLNVKIHTLLIMVAGHFFFVLF
jgi:hypothetical protein